jgi:hypothetical protein
MGGRQGEQHATRPTVDDTWKPEYEELSAQFFSRYFGWPPKLSWAFPSMRTSYPWAAHRPSVVDSRVHAKNNEEYHGLERYAWQYHACNMYEEAYHHFLMAAAHRRADAALLGVQDAGHTEAVKFCVRHALFNEALAECQKTHGRWPEPETYGIDPVKHAKRVERAESELETHRLR